MENCHKGWERRKRGIPAQQLKDFMGEIQGMETWQGFARKDFVFSGHSCILVYPQAFAPGKPWVWRAEFFGAFAQVDEEMLRRGYAVAYCSLSDRYGCPSAVGDMARFHEYMVHERGFAQKAILFGFSRGGLYAVNFALAHPDCVESLYLDAPVLDIRSWPGRRLKDGSARPEWAQCLACYGLQEADMASFVPAPIARAGELAQNGIEVALVAGLEDSVVPYAENGARFAEPFLQAGGTLFITLKPHCDHHPHSLENPEPIARFLDKTAR